MKRIVTLVAILILASCAKQPDLIQRFCSAPVFQATLSGKSREIVELENEGRALATRNPHGAQVPFGRAHQTWLKLKGAYREGDTIRAFILNGLNGRPHMAGYALSRDGCIVETMVTEVSD